MHVAGARRHISKLAASSGLRFPPGPHVRRCFSSIASLPAVLRVVTPRDSPLRPIPPSSEPATRWQKPVTMAAVAVGTSWLAFDNGTYSVGSRGVVTVAIWWAVVILAALGLAPRSRPERGSLVLGGLLVAFGALSLASAAWGASAETALLELDRAALYLGVFTLAVLFGTGSSVRAWAAGLALGIAGIAVIALASRLFPHALDTARTFDVLPVGRKRLSYPVGYWNALAILLALAVPLLLRLAVVSRFVVARGAAVAALPVFGAVLYLTSSRTGVIVAVASSVLFVLLAPRRAAALGALVTGGVGAAFAIAALRDRTALVDGAVASDLVAAQGRSAALLIGVSCLLAGAAYAFGVALARDRLTPGHGLERGLAVAVAVLVVGAVVVAEPVKRFEDFRSPVAGALPTTGPNYIQEHLLSGSGNGRWQLWSAAVDEFRADPLAGGGVGSFAAWWRQHRPNPLFVRDAHSLYAETLAELGIVGFVLLFAIVGGGLVLGLRLIARTTGDERVTAAALVALVAAWALAAGMDWIWEVPAVTAVAFCAFGLLSAGSARAVRPGGVLEVRAALLAVGLFAVVAAALPLLGEVQIRASESAAQANDERAALRHAEAARRLQPWAASPYLQLALLGERRGDFREASRRIHEAVERDTRRWELWVASARIDTKAGDIARARRSLARARALDPIWARAFARASG